MERINVINKEIRIPGLKRTYRILQVTDVHIALWDERDDNAVISYGGFKGRKLISEFGVIRADRFSKGGVSTKDMFAKLCDQLNYWGTECADAVVFTGDIIDFYTHAAFEFMTENLNKLPMPYLFVLGNHDAIFSNYGSEFTLDRFAKLCGGSYKIQKMMLGELTLVGAYNADYFYDDETLGLIASAIKGEENVLLFQHVPINSTAVEENTAAEGLHNLAIGSESNQHKDNKDRIMEIIAADHSPVRAVICGDTHNAHSASLTQGIVQHISPLLFDYPPVLFTVTG